MSMIDGTHFDWRLKDYKGPFVEMIGELDVSGDLFVLPDFPAGVDCRLHSPRKDLYGRLVKFPGTTTPGIYMANNTRNKHWILRVDRDGYMVTIDKWSAEDFLIKGNNGDYVRFMYLDQINADNDIDQSRCTIRLRQRADHVDLSIDLLKVVTDQYIVVGGISKEMSEAIDGLARAMFKEEREVLDVLMVHHLAQSLRQHYADDNARRSMSDGEP